MYRQTRPLLVLVGSLLLSGVLGGASCGASEQPAGADEAAAAAGPRFVAYYFHGNVRCATCRKLEAYSEEAVTGGFADQLASGSLAWRAVNTDEPDNRHFVQDFELVTKSLVLVEYRDGKVVRFQNLPLIWQLVRDKDGFLKYVHDSTRSFIEQS